MKRGSGINRDECNFSRGKRCLDINKSQIKSMTKSFDSSPHQKRQPRQYDKTKHGYQWMSPRIQTIRCISELTSEYTISVFNMSDSSQCRVLTLDESIDLPYKPIVKGVGKEQHNNRSSSVASYGKIWKVDDLRFALDSNRSCSIIELDGRASRESRCNSILEKWANGGVGKKKKHKRTSCKKRRKKRERLETGCPVFNSISCSAVRHSTLITARKKSVYALGMT